MRYLQMRNSKFSLDTDDIEPIEVQTVIDKQALAEFAKGARTHDIIENLESWRNADKEGSPSYNMRLTFNQYQIGLLRHVAKQEKRSLSNLLKLVLFEELEKRIN